MNLQDTLDSMKEKFEASLPPEVKAVMHRATDDLAQSGVMEKVLQPGMEMAHFSLVDEEGNSVNSQDLVAKGPLVVSFYRGVW